MHASPQRLHIEEPGQLPSLRPAPEQPKLDLRMLRFFRLLRLAFWRAFVHDAFATAKASAYSMIFTFFPVLLIIGSVLANWRKGGPYLREISSAMITLWTASGVMISWMDGFRRCYELPKTWGLVQERLIAFLLVVFALIPMTFSTL